MAFQRFSRNQNPIHSDQVAVQLLPNDLLQTEGLPHYYEKRNFENGKKQEKT